MATDTSDVLIALIKSPSFILLTVALISWLGYMFDVPILEQVVQSLLALKELILPSVVGG